MLVHKACSFVDFQKQDAFGMERRLYKTSSFVGFHVSGKESRRFLSKEVSSRMGKLIYLGLAKEIFSINEAAYFTDINSWEFRKQMNN